MVFSNAALPWEPSRQVFNTHSVVGELNSTNTIPRPIMLYHGREALESGNGKGLLKDSKSGIDGGAVSQICP